MPCREPPRQPRRLPSLLRKEGSLLLFANRQVRAYDSIRMDYPNEIKCVLRALDHVVDEAGGAEGADANLSCGCVVRFRVSIDGRSGVVRGAGFRSNGCGYMVAASEIAAATIEGLGLSELGGDCRNVLQTAFARSIGEVPAGRRDCVAAVSNAAIASFAACRRKQIEEFQGEAAIVCTCFGVTESQIEDAVLNGGCRTVRDLGDATNAGTGCGSCQMLIREILDASGQAV